MNSRSAMFMKDEGTEVLDLHLAFSHERSKIAEPKNLASSSVAVWPLIAQDFV